MSNDEYKNCPYCNEEIRAIALKCRYCLSLLYNNRSAKEDRHQSVTSFQESPLYKTEQIKDVEEQVQRKQDEALGHQITGFLKKSKPLVAKGNLFTDLETERHGYYDEALAKRLNELKIERPNWIVAQLIKELEKEGYEIESQEQISFLLRYPNGIVDET